MFELSKVVLENVSFDKTLFSKELNKAIRWVKPDEKTHLKLWCLEKFKNKYNKEIFQEFNNTL